VADPAAPPATTATPDVTRFGNADFEWDGFDSAAYFDDNYRDLRPDDDQIIKIVADFFQNHGPRRWRDRAIDVGSGANLYPAMTMVPFASEVSLYERAFTNRQWLAHQLDEPYSSWRQFWDAMSRDRENYQITAEPLDLLHQRAKVVKGDIFGLRPEQFDIGTMFFVAESITTRDDEFTRATKQFVRSLKPEAPFAAAFMRDSSGYRVGDREFPACSVNEADVERCLNGVAHIADIRTVASTDLRDGYCGMIVATGRRRA
jgi:hypothetical protein